MYTTARVCGSSQIYSSGDSIWWWKPGPLFYHHITTILIITHKVIRLTTDRWQKDYGLGFLCCSDKLKFALKRTSFHHEKQVTETQLKEQKIVPLSLGTNWFKLNTKKITTSSKTTKNDTKQNVTWLLHTSHDMSTQVYLGWDEAVSVLVLN